MNYALWDLDNCLANDAWRIPFIDWREGLTPDQRYAEYHRCCGRDQPGNVSAFNAVRLFAEPVFFTARPESVRATTVDWIERHLAVARPLVLMRRDGEHTPSAELKRAMVWRLRNNIGVGDKIVAALAR